jgi:hypothetical protein
MVVVGMALGVPADYTETRMWCMQDQARSFEAELVVVRITNLCSGQLHGVWIQRGQAMQIV